MCINVDIDKLIEQGRLPQRGHSEEFEDGERFRFLAWWEGEEIAYSPAHGHQINWGDSPDDVWKLPPAKFVGHFFVPEFH